MSFLTRRKVKEAPPPIDPADTANRIDQVRQRRLRSGGRASTFLSSAAAEPGAATPAPTLTGVV